MLMILLDEMNLARTEYYFSESSRGLEMRGTRDPDGENGTARSDAAIAIELPYKEGETPETLYVPHNVLWVGTLNEDETTQALSDKVLDRANSIKFAPPKAKTIVEHAKPPSRGRDQASGHLDFHEWLNWSEADDTRDVANREEHDAIMKMLVEIMQSADRGFGYRVAQSISAYVARYPDPERWEGRARGSDQHATSPEALRNGAHREQRGARQPPEALPGSARRPRIRRGGERGTEPRATEPDLQPGPATHRVGSTRGGVALPELPQPGPGGNRRNRRRGGAHRATHARPRGVRGHPQWRRRTSDPVASPGTFEDGYPRLPAPDFDPLPRIPGSFRGKLRAGGIGDPARASLWVVAAVAQERKHADGDPPEPRGTSGHPHRRLAVPADAHGQRERARGRGADKGPYAGRHTCCRRPQVRSRSTDRSRVHTRTLRRHGTGQWRTIRLGRSSTRKRESFRDPSTRSRRGLDEF